MKTTAIFVMLVAYISVLPQVKDPAVATYASNNRLISITNLTGLSECSGANISGKIGKVKRENAIANVSVKSEDSNALVVIPLDRVKPEELSTLFKDLVRKQVRVRIAGYRCKPEDAITAFSVDRIY